jgi:5-methyltetrahydrofolate--homocysteine methyltransferase
MLSGPTGKMNNIIKPVHAGITLFKEYPLEALVDYINWSYFFHEWRLNGKFPAIFNDPLKGEEAAKLFADAQQMLELIVKEKWILANGTAGIFPANAVGEDIEVYSPEAPDKLLTTFHFLRNQQQQENKPNYCLSDFIAPKKSGLTDYIGCFAVTAGIGIEKKVNEFENAHDDYGSIMLKILADRLAEAFTELLHLKVRKELWGYAKDENLSLSELQLGKYHGIRPAPGYPACPDHSEKVEIFKLLNVTKNTGISLTETFMMNPAASVCGWYFANPQATYFSVGKISKEQVIDYAQRKKISVEKAEKWLAPVIGY